MKQYYLVILFLCSYSFTFAQSTGINTVNPHTVLDVNGSFALRENALTLANGDNDLAAPADNSFFRVSGPTAPFAITGIGNGSDGRIITFYNATLQPLTIKNLNSNSTTANQIKTLTNADLVFAAANSLVTLQYNSTESKWLPVSSQNQTLGQTAVSVLTSSSTLIPPNTAGVNLALGTSITVPAGYVTHIISTGGIEVAGSSAAAFTATQIYMIIDGAVYNPSIRTITLSNTSQQSASGLPAYGSWNIDVIAALAPGVHSIALFGTGITVSGSVFAFAGGASGSGTQGVLNVILIKQ